MVNKSFRQCVDFRKHRPANRGPAHPGWQEGQTQSQPHFAEGAKNSGRCICHQPNGASEKTPMCTKCKSIPSGAACSHIQDNSTRHCTFLELGCTLVSSLVWGGDEHVTEATQCRKHEICISQQPNFVDCAADPRQRQVSHAFLNGF